MYIVNQYVGFLRKKIKKRKKRIFYRRLRNGVGAPRTTDLVLEVLAKLLIKIIAKSSAIHEIPT